MYMSRVRLIRDKNGRDKYYNVDTMRHNTEMIQNGEGCLQLTGKAAKDIATKAETKAIEKGAEHVIGEKIYDKFNNHKQRKHQRQDTKGVKQHKQDTGPYINRQEDKGEKFIKLLHTQTQNKKMTQSKEPPNKHFL
ncbi:hypothetical protein pdam_00009758, partial [Pocillopora damicornis]